MSKTREWPREPAEAWTQDPVNPRRNQAGKGLIFIRPAGGFGLGHVGWGYLDDRDHVPKDDTSDLIVAVDKWLVGSVDNPHHRPIAAAGQQGFWQIEYTGEPLEFMRGRRYEYYKVVAVPNVNIERALEEAEKVRQHPYELIGANCEDAVYNILTAYGADLPNPRDIRDWEPNLWFSRISGLRYATGDDTGLCRDMEPELRQAMQRRRLRLTSLTLIAAVAGLLCAALIGLRMRGRRLVIP